MLAFVAMFGLGGTRPAVADLHSYAFVQEDGSLRIKGRTVHLYGIYIPPTNRSCRTWQRPVECSSRGALALDFRIGTHFVRCERQWTNSDRSVTAICVADGEDLAAYLLERGWAMALPDAPFEYHALEKIARSQERGVWGFQVDSITRRRNLD
jgi:endonuclease YncB( thermonuclease family)